jgi:hypothetical protein
MATNVDDAIDVARRAIGSANGGAKQAVGTAKHVLDSAREGAEHAATKARSRWWDGVREVTEIAAMLRSLQGDDVLGWMGLARRRGPLASLGLFGAGLAVGAGAGLLLAPMSGGEMRRRILERLIGAKSEAEASPDPAKVGTNGARDEVRDEPPTGSARAASPPRHSVS